MHTELNYGVSAIAKRTSTDKSLVRKWLIKAGVYKTGGRSCSPIIPRKVLQYDGIKLMAQEFSNETKRVIRLEKSLIDKSAKRALAVIRDRLKLKSDPIYRAKFYLRKRLKSVIREHRQDKPCHSISHVIGCTSDHLMKHIESKFRDGMGWHNMGWTWELDHIRPLSSFDLRRDEDVSIAGHWTNIQPLLVHENRTKSARFPPQPFKALVTNHEFNP